MKILVIALAEQQELSPEAVEALSKAEEHLRSYKQAVQAR
jgi:hypothetical protein